MPGPYKTSGGSVMVWTCTSVAGSREMFSWGKGMDSAINVSVINF